jgi:NAD(P)-dependent dehydrogenase (short-subunit alcohol dehydrogenase family)
MSVALITGASRGIGRAIAVHLARHGFEAYASMRDLGDGSPLVRLAEAEGLALHPITLDVTDDASVRSAVEHVLERTGQIDALVNNAAIARFAPIEHTAPAALAGVLDTNLVGALRTAQAVLPTMRARGRGTIVNISSVAGRVAPFCFGSYVMAKWALEAASEMLAQEVTALGIRVALIEPGFHATRMLDDATQGIGIDPGSAYADAERRTVALFAANKQIAADPQRVAEAVHEAITTRTPRFRYPVGVDADVFLGGRARMADEDWVALGRRMTDEEYFAEFAARFPIPVPA